MDPLRRTRTNPDIERMLRVMDLLRVLDREVPAQVLSCLFYIASHDGCHKTAMEEDLGLTTASSSRNIDRLTKQHRLGKPGMDLISKEVDPTNKKRLTLHLNQRGHDLVRQIESILYG
jgi:DNA-binding MarR family transcriptional regulator